MQHWGERILHFLNQSAAPSLFTSEGFRGAVLDWAMRDPHFKTQLFRFVDVLPSLSSSAEISRHLKEYIGGEDLPGVLRTGLNAAWFFSAGIKSQVTALARQFMLGNERDEITAALRRLHDQGIAFTVDVLGEAVVSEREADVYAARYLELMAMLADEIRQWPQPCHGNATARGEIPALNLSVKISALYSQIHPADPETSVQKIAERLRPILRRARELGAFINFDMESYALRRLTLDLFETIFAETEFAQAPACGIAIQAYLKESGADLMELLEWARKMNRRITIRLVKGAYWDYETVIARQKGWPVPVFDQKSETDANYEELSKILLENREAVDAAFGTHNIRSIAHVLAQAERLGVDRREFEFQMLYGMADPIKAALLDLDCRVREYCPVGELLPGMAYLVRRLLENTSNEGFLANAFVRNVPAHELLRNPKDIPRQTQLREFASRPFRNEPPADFTIAAERRKIREALAQLRRRLGRQHPLVVNNKWLTTRDWLPSLNPADQHEVIGYAARATIEHADSALAAARAAQPAWGRVPPEDRAGLLDRVALLMRRDKAALSALEILEAGKNWTEADSDVNEAIDFCAFYAAETRKLGQPRRTQETPGETNFQTWRARGVGVVIAPWNFPLAILTGMTAAALTAGNTVIIKPSDQTPIIASRLMELLMEAGLPPGVANFLPGPGRTIGAHLVEHPKIDFIAFTGSKEVGLGIWEAAGRTKPGQANLKKVICEMGGKNCVIIDSDADLDEAVAGCIASAFGYQGQKCSALSRLIVLAEIYDKFMERFVGAAESLRVGPAELPGVVVGPVISREAQARILKMIENGSAEARLIWQGRVPDDPNACYVPPAIFSDVPSSSRLFHEEIFGPVLAVTKAKDFDHAMALANDSEFALTGGIYSRSPVHIARTKAELVCGNLYINRGITGALVERQPFGGFKMSGGGTKAGGDEYLRNFLVPEVITENCLRRGFAGDEE